MVRGGRDARVLDRVRVRPHPRLRLRERAARDGPAVARARLVAVLVQPRRRNRAAARRRRRRVRGGGSRPPQRGGGTPARVRRTRWSSSPRARSGSCNGCFSREAAYESWMWCSALVVGSARCRPLAVRIPGAAAAGAEGRRSREAQRQPATCSKAAAATPPSSSAASGVVVVDTKNPGWGQPILDKIKELTDKPVTTIINTHTHGDHVSGNVEFPATVDVVVQENTKANMEKMRGRPASRRPAAGRTSSRRTTAGACRSGRSRTR